MATTFRIEVCSSRKRQDGTYNVKIRVTHNRKIKRIATSIYVKKEDMTRGMKIKNQSILDELNKIIDSYRSKCNILSLSINSMSIEEVVEFVTRVEEDKKDIDFIQFAREHIEKMDAEGRKGTSSNYKCTIKAMIEFTGREVIGVSEITYKFLNDFSKFIIEKKEKANKEAIAKGRRVTSNCMLCKYTSCIRHLYNQAKLKYNDEERGVIRIPWAPFAKFKVPREEVARKRAIPPFIIKMIADLPYKYRSNMRKSIEQNCRYNLAKDCFILSFCLIGMNSVDLYNCDELKDNMIKYFRTKTATRRDDKAEIHVKVTPFIKNLMEKYEDKTKQKVFRFSRMYVNHTCFNSAINKGLKEIEKDINAELKRMGKDIVIDDLEFYAARHSWATIARNDLKIDKYVVHEALNHVDSKMKITDIYIEKDFTMINEANRKVIDYVFNNQMT